MTVYQSPKVLDTLLATLAESEVFDLSHQLFPGMPVAPTHSPYAFTLARRHGDQPRDDGTCTANEMIVMTGHTGTHVDALGHFSRAGKLAGGVDASSAQTGGHGLQTLGAERLAPVVCRGILLDVAALHGVTCLDAGYEVTAEDLEAAERRAGVQVTAGDAVLVRTGWATHWPDRTWFVGAAGGTPGPGMGAADWLIERGVQITGSDTLVFEVVQPERNSRPVHGRFLIDAEIPIMETLYLEELAAAKRTEFLFLVAPLKLEGATGSPARPLAICPPQPAPAVTANDGDAP